MPKTVHITSVHRPFDTRIFYKECKTLAENGYEVVLIVPHDFDEMLDGVQIRAIPKAAGRWKRMTATVGHVYRAALAEEAHIYHIHDPELIPVGLLLKMKGKLVVYDAHEDLPRQILSKPWVPLVFRRVLSMLASLIVDLAGKVFDGIVSATPFIARRFHERKTVTVQNYPILGELLSSDLAPYVKRPSNITYVGGITTRTGVREMVDALGRLPESLNVSLDLAGDFRPPTLEREVRRIPGWRRVNFLGWQTRPQVAKLLCRARAGLVVLHPELNYLDSYPIKLFEYMSTGLPVVASDFPLWRKIVTDADCGLLVDPLDPRAIARGIQWLLENPIEAEAMGRRGLAAVYKKYNWDREARKLLRLYDRLLR
jgi:glycosyltransferase involved in cell wall biosynthesis